MLKDDSIEDTFNNDVKLIFKTSNYKIQSRSQRWMEDEQTKGRT